ncbi:bifunctional folylpolyglutamate synthase/dihydrofolate synthase [Chloroflexota bacterium]
MDYQQAVDYIFSYTDYEKEPMPHDPAFYDLRRVEELLARFGNPHLGARTVHIAGTNGKGSTAAMVASVLTASGYTTGLYTSPHLHTWRERIKVNGELISEVELVSLVERLKPEFEMVNRKATYGQLTTFELLTVLGFAYFSLKEVDFQVLEVGLGGKFDATNVIQPEICVITSISFDHRDVLGNSLAEIATEKVGIIKPGCVVVTSPQHNEVTRIIEETCVDYGVELIRVGVDVVWQELGFVSNQQVLQVKGKSENYKLSIPLLGYYQLENVATAVAALEVLAGKGFNISKDSITRGLAQVRWPGRFQILSHHPLILVDGAHNPDSARRLKQSIERYFKTDSHDQAILVIGASFDKDIGGVVSELFSLFDKVIATSSRHPRAMASLPIVAEFRKHGIEAQAVDNVPAALSLALAVAGDKDFICVAGSLFVIAEAIEQVNKLRLSI